MSRDKGNRAAGWVADFVRPWWPHAEKTPNGRPGPDLLGTPPVRFEVKTPAQWRPGAWMRQAARYAADGELAVLLYVPPGLGQARVGDAMAIMPLKSLMPVLAAAGYAPPPGDP